MKVKKNHLSEHVDLLLAAILGDFDPLVNEPDPDVVSSYVGSIRPQIFLHLFVDGERGDFHSFVIEQAKLSLKVDKEMLSFKNWRFSYFSLKFEQIFRDWLCAKALRSYALMKI